MEKIYIIFRRAYEQDDLDYGSFEPIYLSGDIQKIINVFTGICKSILEDNLASNIKETLLKNIEYQRNNWCYQYKVDTFYLDKMCAKVKGS